MIVAFTLTMPSNNAWNGQWSGEENLYVITRTLRSEKWAESLDKQCYSYDFGDGRRAQVRAEIVDANKARKLRKASSGFCGYNWMVKEILSHGRILTLAERSTPIA